MAEVKEMEKLPEGWKRVRLGDVANFYKGRIYLKSDSTDKGKYEFIHYGELFTTYKEHIKEIISRINRNEGAFLSKTNDVLMPTSDVTPTGLATASCIKKDGIILGSDILVIRCFDKIEGIFLSYFIRLNKSKILQLIKGTTVYHLYASDLKNFVFLVPSVPEQRKIAEIIETVDNAIEKTDRIIEKYKRIKQGLMQDLLTKGIDENGQIRSEETHRFKDSPLGRIPEEWEVLELEKVAEPKGIVRGPFGGMLKKEIFVPRGYKVYEQGNAIYKSVKLGNYYIDSKKYKQMLRFAVKPKDFIISCSGTIGKIFMIPDNFEEGIINQALLKITIDDKRFNHKFFEYFFDWDHFQTKIIDYTQGGAMQNLIGINEFKKIGFPKPPLPEQRRIASILSQIDETIEKEQRYKEKLERIKLGLMEDLLTGKVRINHLIEGVENVS